MLCVRVHVCVCAVCLSDLGLRKVRALSHKDHEEAGGAPPLLAAPAGSAHSSVGVVWSRIHSMVRCRVACFDVVGLGVDHKPIQQTWSGPGECWAAAATRAVLQCAVGSFSAGNRAVE